MDNVCIVSAMPVSQTNSKLSLILEMKAFYEKEIHCKVSSSDSYLFEICSPDLI